MESHKLLIHVPDSLLNSEASRPVMMSIVIKLLKVDPCKARRHCKHGKPSKNRIILSIEDSWHLYVKTGFKTVLLTTYRCHIPTLKGRHFSLTIVQNEVWLLNHQHLQKASSRGERLITKRH